MAALWALFAAINAAYSTYSFTEGNYALGAFNGVAAIFMLVCAIKEA